MPQVPIGEKRSGITNGRNAGALLIRVISGHSQAKPPIPGKSHRQCATVVTDLFGTGRPHLRSN
jgi:hypothetical protein